MNHYDLVIIGFGPAGATLANLVGAHGLRTLVLEKEAEVYPLPRAIHFDGEVMRVFETAGLRAAAERVSRPGLKGMYFNNAAGETLLIRAGTNANGPHGCANNHYFHQPELEHLLRDGVERFPCVDVRLQHEVTQIDNKGAAGATLSVQNLLTGHTETVHTRYVIGCDGARSLVRKTMGSPMIDLGLHQPWLVFDVRLKGDVPGLPDHTVQHCDPERPMTYCNVTGNRRRWEIMVMPGDDPAQLVQPATLWSLVSRWVTPEQADIERAVIYTFHSVIAQGWRQGPLLLAGDAAHQTPPFLGQGMCAAIRDVANLAWKLEAVLRGRADDSLLDTYEAERAPHVHAFIELAVKLGAIIQTTDPNAARERDASFKAGQPTVFEYPAPRLGPGFWQGSAAPVAQVFPQPTLADGRLLDQVTGARFAIIATPALWSEVQPATREQWARWGTALVPADDPALAHWLSQHHTSAVVLRPDRYIAGTATSASELDALTENLLGVRVALQ